MSGVDQARMDEVNTVAGFLKPEWSTDPIPGQRQTHWLAMDDAQKCIDGYACANCLADYGGVYRPRCPVCHNERDLEQDMADFPELWADHLKARKDAVENPRERRMVTFDEVFGGVAHDPDVEQTSLSKLGRSKWGRK